MYSDSDNDTFDDQEYFFAQIINKKSIRGANPFFQDI